MTEIPEHLLKRSKAAKGGTSDSDSSAGDSASKAPVAAQPKAAAPAAPAANFPDLDPKPEASAPEPAYVSASKARRRVPVWALPVVAALPVWALSFAGTMQLPEREDALLTEAAEVYTVTGGCAGCHGAAGGGGTGYQMSDGEVIATFPEAIDQMVHVARGSAAIAGQTYGADGRRVAGDLGVMPAQSSLSMLELQLVIYHERAVLSAEEEELEGDAAAAYAEWAEELRHAAEVGEDGGPIDLDLLLACADPSVTPGATGTGSPDPEAKPCPGPHAGGGEE